MSEISKNKASAEFKEPESANETEVLVKEIEESFTFLQKAADNFDNRYISKVFRDLGRLRLKISQNPECLRIIINKTYANDHPNKLYLVVIN